MRSDVFRAAAEAKDFSAVDELFSEDVTFRSPVVFRPYEGREALGVLLGFTVVPGVVVGLALLFLRAYDLTADRLAGMVTPETQATT